MASPRLRATLVTLGVADVARAARFYETLGMKRGVKAAKDVAFFEAGGIVLSLYGRGDLAKDAGIENSRPGFSGVALAFNVAEEALVEKVLEAAIAAGGRMTKPAQRAFWGGYSGYFADPDGHLWEVAHNPGFPLNEDGQIRLPE
jgi:catechol 2,3-dioxygenase-like lactoylglutathione lyase family enzyme